jgi:hypothetical protein
VSADEWMHMESPYLQTRSQSQNRASFLWKKDVNRAGYDISIEWK